MRREGPHQHCTILLPDTIIGKRDTCCEFRWHCPYMHKIQSNHIFRFRPTLGFDAARQPLKRGSSLPKTVTPIVVKQRSARGRKSCRIRCNAALLVSNQTKHVKRENTELGFPVLCGGGNGPGFIDNGPPRTATWVIILKSSTYSSKVNIVREQIPKLRRHEFAASKHRLGH